MELQNKIVVTGRIFFDPEDKTKKHEAQSSWKKVAIVHIGGDVSEYYAWFIKRRYNIGLLPPLRGPHVTFINDRKSEMNDRWEQVKKKWDGKEIEIVLSVDAKTDSADTNKDAHWWLNIPHEDRGQLQSIRDELGLGKPFFGLHMTIGLPVNFYDNDHITGVKAKQMNVEQSVYIHNLIKRGKI